MKSAVKRSGRKRFGGLLLCLCLFSAALQATPSGSASEPGRLSASEPLACLVFDAGMPYQLGLQGTQVVEWQRLERQHASLFGGRCSSTFRPSAVQVREAGEAGGIISLQVYQKDLYDFVSGLSDAQRARLGEIAQAHHDSRAALEEKLIRHRLML